MPFAERPTMPIRPSRLAAFAVMMLGLALAGCGSVGMEGVGGPPGGVTAPPTPPAGAITLSGVATFARVPTSGAGLDYAATAAKPIRNAIVQVRSAAGSTVLYEAATDALGNWSIFAPQSANVNLVVLAELGTPSAVDTKIVDNANGDAVYSIYLAKTTTAANESGIVINAASGWTGSSYGAVRASAPFAILDTIYQAQQLIRSADAGVSFPQLVVEWSPANSAATINTSHFDPLSGRLTILGKEDEDTDEFDTHVIAHEWGHWHQHHFSRDDSVGGPHGYGDILDETVAFSEGWGNAFSGMVNRDPLYIDTAGPGQGVAGVILDLEADEVALTATVGGGDPRTLDGGWSELSVQELLWDAFDGTGGINDTDADGVALGFTPLYQVLVGQQKTFSGFTSIYCFLFHLKSQNPASAAAMTALEAAQGIGAHDAYQQTAPGLARYTQVPSNGTSLTADLDGFGLTTYDDYGPITSYAGNMLYNHMLFYAIAPSTGTFRIRATPLTISHDLFLLRPNLFSPNAVDAVVGGSEYLDISATAGAKVVFSVGSFATAGNSSGVTPFRLQFGTPVQVGKPQEEDDPPPAMPAANG
jgi:hypothetical protein